VISTRHFTWLRTPKTGGTWLEAILMRHAPPDWAVQPTRAAHTPLVEAAASLAPERVALPVLASVRNPWDWYVSLYFFMEQHRADHPRWTPFSKGCSVAGFRAALPGLLAGLHEGPDSLIRTQAASLRDAYGQLGVRPIRFEGLRQETIAAIAKTGARVPSAMREEILWSAPRNETTHSLYQAYCTPELREQVAQREAWVIEALGYAF